MSISKVDALLDELAHDATTAAAAAAKVTAAFTALADDVIEPSLTDIAEKLQARGHGAQIVTAGSGIGLKVIKGNVDVTGNVSTMMFEPSAQPGLLVGMHTTYKGDTGNVERSAAPSEQITASFVEDAALKVLRKALV